MCLFCFKQKTAYEMRISDWSSDVCSSDLAVGDGRGGEEGRGLLRGGAGEEGVPPAGEIEIAAADDGHQMRLGERRGEEFVAAGFPRRAVAVFAEPFAGAGVDEGEDRKSTRLNSSH